MKKITWKLIACFMAVLLLCMPVLTGCDKAEDEPKNTVGEESKETAEEKTEEKTEGTTEGTTEETTEQENAIETSKGLAFVSYGDGTCYVSGIGECTDTDIVIPSVSPDGDRVVRIGANSLGYNSELRSVVVPVGVTSIGQQAFCNCSNLTDVTLPDGLMSIENYAFEKCSNLVNINIPDSVIEIYDGVFDKCSKLVFHEENGVRYIDRWAIWCR